MTYDPRFPTLEEVMDGSPFDIVDSPWGHIERWRATAPDTPAPSAAAQVPTAQTAKTSAHSPQSPPHPSPTPPLRTIPLQPLVSSHRTFPNRPPTPRSPSLS